MLLWLITVVSLAVGAAAVVWALRVQRAEAARTAVRVSALAAAIDAPADTTVPVAPSVELDDSPWFPATEPASAARHASEARYASGDRHEVDSSGAAASLFASERPASGRSAFGPVLALGALVLIATIAGATMLAGGGDASGDAGAPAEASAAPIELVSMTDRTEQGTVTISGLVRNPRGTAPVERLTAVVFFFDGQGGFLASARALVDFPRLAGGDESPFVIAAPAPRGASRYRVSFRAGESGIVPHVDRRGDR